ncbi:MAG: S8 family serine peptidase [Bacillota bacterium]|nr:S8 family serine peptidase [Bacillota bacterium]
MKHSKAITGQLYDEDGHGTHVAGIVGAVADNGAGIAGVSYNAKIIAINVFERNDKGEWLSSTDYMIKALSYIEELVSTGKVKNLHVINISSGQYAYDQSLEESIKRMSYTIFPFHLLL